MYEQQFLELGMAVPYNSCEAVFLHKSLSLCFNKETLTGELAVRHVISSVPHTTAGSVYEQQILELGIAVPYHSCQTVVCTSHCARG